MRTAIGYRKPRSLEEAIAQLLLADGCAEEGHQDVRDGDWMHRELRLSKRERHTSPLKLHLEIKLLTGSPKYFGKGRTELTICDKNLEAPVAQTLGGQNEIAY